MLVTVNVTWAHKRAVSSLSCEAMQWRLTQLLENRLPCNAFMSVAGAALFFVGWGPESPWYRTAIGTMLWAMQYYVFVAEFS